MDGKATGPIVYCEQKAPTTLKDLDDIPTRFGLGKALEDQIINFISAVDDTIVKVPARQEPTQADLAELTYSTPQAGWSAQALWVSTWNRVYSTEPIKTHRLWESNLGEEAYYQYVPVVECATEEGEETIKLTQSMTIGLSASHCGASTNKSVKLEIYAPLADTRSNNMHVRPVIAANGKAGNPSVNVAASKMLTITCPATSANRYRELLPDNAWSPSRR